MQIYVVEIGDTIDKIAVRFGVEPLRLAWENQIEYPYRLAVGQALLVSDERKDAEPDLNERPAAAFNGYAYPWINSQVLEETCRYLTDISIFSYGFTVDGELVPPADQTGEQKILTEAKRHDVDPVLVLTPLGPDGHFNNNLVTVVVKDLEVQQKLIRNIWEMVQEKNYRAVDVDFEYVLAEDRELLVDFVRRLRIIMNQYGIRVTVALAPKTSGDQRGLLYEGIDYGALGRVANGVLLMTYEWGYTYEPITTG